METEIIFQEQLADSPRPAISLTWKLLCVGKVSSNVVDSYDPICIW